LNRGISAVNRFLAGMARRVQGYFSGAASWLVTAGHNIIQGLINGVEGAAGALYSHLSNIAHNAAGIFSSLWKMHSPSMLFHEMGQNVMRGLQLGLESQSTSLYRTASRVADGVTRALSGSTGAIPIQLRAGGAGLGGATLPSVTAAPRSVVSAGGGHTLILNVHGSILAEKDLVRIANRGLARTQRLSGNVVTG
jgi:hypothetical protein